MTTQQHFEELLRLLEKNSVDYLIVGGYAVAFHGYPRFTKDIDIYYSDLQENIAKVKNALIEFGFTENDLPDSLFLEKGSIIQFGVTPLRVDLLNEIDGIIFNDAKKNLIRGKYGDVEINFIGKEDLIKNKLATKRPQDKVDAEYLKSNY